MKPKKMPRKFTDGTDSHALGRNNRKEHKCNLLTAFTPLLKKQCPQFLSLTHSPH